MQRDLISKPVFYGFDLRNVYVQSYVTPRLYRVFAELAEMARTRRVEQCVNWIGHEHEFNFQMREESSAPI